MDLEFSVLIHLSCTPGDPVVVCSGATIICRAPMTEREDARLVRREMAGAVHSLALLAIISRCLPAAAAVPEPARGNAWLIFREQTAVRTCGGSGGARGGSCACDEKADNRTEHHWSSLMKYTIRRAAQ